MTVLLSAAAARWSADRPAISAANGEQPAARRAFTACASSREPFADATMSAYKDKQKLIA
jgi:hypothetical protein